ncbi:Bromodomain containing protein [Tritrichomonas foetus]|uniref:Bromodomain containing protein n=1 Tax=Tritrichomonas foetus TaxID=1144522 RepID=A0A1J4KK66_9EUKA|nr:Bromodomain containing protein [Tritrichomonas foetus]|eukprot:OHT09741.1 Bromodomain containing protein [Tritrichomonas foetus]
MSKTLNGLFDPFFPIMQLNEFLKNEAINAMNRILAHPISTKFRIPITPENAPEHYFEKVKNPTDLNTIKTKIQDGRISTIQQWFEEMDHVWGNIELFYGKESPFSIAANEIKRLFNKERKKLVGMTIGTWCGHVYEMRTVITDLMNQPPSKVKQFADTLGAARSMKPNQQVMNERELQSFIKATEMMTSEEDQKELIKIITEQQPDLDCGNSELFIDVSKLNRNTVKIIKDYIKESLEKNGKKYPEF